jgi:hypothetical protein
MNVTSLTLVKVEYAKFAGANEADTEQDSEC